MENQQVWCTSELESAVLVSCYECAGVSVIVRVLECQLLCVCWSVSYCECAGVSVTVSVLECQLL